MNFFSAFAASFGAMLLTAALIASWLFRSSGAPLVAKLAVPALIVALACATPYQVNTMLGFPVSAQFAMLPARAELIAFVAQENDARVDLWLRQGDAPPRSYEITLDGKLKKTLRDAQSKLRHGGRVMLVKARRSTKQAGIAKQSAPDEPGYELDDRRSRYLRKADSSADNCTLDSCDLQRSVGLIDTRSPAMPTSIASYTENFEGDPMLRIAVITAFVLGLAPMIAGPALGGDKKPSPPCKPLDKLRAEFDRKTHLTTLTPGQFHFVEGLYVGSPTTPDGLPPGDSALLATHDGVKNGIIIWTRGPLACAPIAVSEKLINLIAGIKTGALDGEGEEL